jgi:hypothetical protein
MKVSTCGLTSTAGTSLNPKLSRAMSLSCE